MVDFTDLILFVIAVIVHEIGHYIGFLYFGSKPTVKFMWWGISVGENVYLELKPIQFYIVLIIGIGAGWFVISYANLLGISAYILTSSANILNIIGIFNLSKAELKMKKIIKELQEVKQHNQEINNIRIKLLQFQNELETVILPKLEELMEDDNETTNN